MKKLFTFVCVVALAAVMGIGVKAQTPEGLGGGSYVLIYIDGESYATIPAKNILADMTPNDYQRYLYIWEDTYTMSDPVGKNYYNNLEGYMTATVGAKTWSGFGFYLAKNEGNVATGAPVPPVDLTSVNGNFTFHMAMKSNATNSHLLILSGGKAALEGKLCIGQTNFVDNTIPYAPYTDFVRDGEWHLIEIPMSAFMNAGLKYPEPFNDSNYFAMLSGENPGATFSLDAIFIYNKAGNGINAPEVGKLEIIPGKNVINVLNATAPIEVYNMAGQQVLKTNEPGFPTSRLAKGIYVVKSGSAVAKVSIN
ncbi:MAG: T9SS type A sorting domain-containing protein [Dysgonamonadaceae bacterium]|jgi:hypothetical protein|nr:T9SS type A sorting domain-containing protein [Dysgonamonadaceae bacterium]